MIAEMAGRVQGFHAPSIARDDVAVGETDVRLKSYIHSFAATHQATFRQSLHNRAAPSKSIGKRVDRSIDTL